MSGGGPMIPPSFVTLQQLKELKEKRDEEERLKREAAAREEEERRRMLEQRPRVEVDERERQRAENPRWKKNRRHRKPRGSPPKREAQAAPAGAGSNPVAAEPKTKREGTKEKRRGGRITGMRPGANGSEEGSEGIGAPIKGEEEKSAKVSAVVKGPARVKVSGARSWRPVRVIGSPQPGTVADVDDKRVPDLNAGCRDGSPAVSAPVSDPNPDADIEKRISDLKLGARNPNPMRRWGRGRGGGWRSGRWSGDGMMWVEKTTAA